MATYQDFSELHQQKKTAYETFHREAGNIADQVVRYMPQFLSCGESGIAVAEMNSGEFAHSLPSRFLSVDSEHKVVFRLGIAVPGGEVRCATVRISKGNGNGFKFDIDGGKTCLVSPNNVETYRQFTEEFIDVLTKALDRTYPIPE